MQRFSLLFLCSPFNPPNNLFAAQGTQGQPETRIISIHSIQFLQKTCSGPGARDIVMNLHLLLPAWAALGWAGGIRGSRASGHPGAAPK